MNESTVTGAEILTERIGAGAVVALDSLGVIEVAGDDAREFLQGQFSNDIDALAAIDGDAGARCQLNAYCNPKGRALAVVRVLRLGDGWRLLAPAALADALMMRLRMFVLRAKVSVELQSPARWGVIGAPVLRGEALRGDGLLRAQVAGAVPRQLVIGDAQPSRAGEFTVEASDTVWRLADILSGIPQIYPATAEEFIAQFINLDRVDGVSFSKGCYPGQEIIARLRHRGRVKQRMVAARARVDALAPGDAVYDGGDKKIGAVVDAVQLGDGEFIFSAVAPAPLGDTVMHVGGARQMATRIALPTDAEESAAAEAE